MPLNSTPFARCLRGVEMSRLGQHKIKALSLSAVALHVRMHVDWIEKCSHGTSSDPIEISTFFFFSVGMELI